MQKAPAEERKSLTENLMLVKTYKKPPADFKQNIKAIVAGMRNLDTTVTDESVFESVAETIEMHVTTYETFFINHPMLLKPENFQKTTELMKKMVVLYRH